MGKQTLGEFIKAYRAEYKLSMDAFAEKAGVTKAYISMLENGVKNRGGRYPAPSLTTYQRCAAAMGMDADTLIRSVVDNISLLPSEHDELSAEEQKLIKSFRELSEINKIRVIERVESLLDAQKKELEESSRSVG